MMNSLTGIINSAIADISSGGGFNLRWLAKEIGAHKSELTSQHIEFLAAPLAGYVISCLELGTAKDLNGIDTFIPIFKGLQIKLRFSPETVSKLRTLFEKYDISRISEYIHLRGAVLDPFTNEPVMRPNRSFQKEMTAEKEEMYRLRSILLAMHGEITIYEGASKETILAVKQFLEEALGVLLPEIEADNLKYLT